MIVSIIWQILLAFLLFSVFIILFKFKRNYNEEEIKDSRVFILLEEFKDNNKYLIIDHIIFLLRRSFLSILIIFGWGYGLFQGCIFFVVCVGVLISKIVLRPFKNSILNVQGVVFEFILWIVIGLLASFYNKADEFSTTGNVNVRGILWFALVCSLMLISYIFTFILFALYCWSKRKSTSNEINNVVPKAKENAYKIKKTIGNFKCEQNNFISYFI